jgi:ABC-2 type transport system ATP-binding protein
VPRPHHLRRVAALAPLVVALVALSPQAPTPSGAAPTAASTCHRAPAAPVVATRVAGTTNDWDVTSFDGTVIRAHWFPRATSTSTSAPTLLMGPGWGGAGDASPSAPALFGGLSIDAMHDAGYNVLTWDPRGFGASGGNAEVDSTQYEARDVGRLLDWIAPMPGVQLDGPGDPRVGMVGGSYGGGIQFATAAVDCRVDAIVPTIAWNSLLTSLDKSGIVKAGWAGLLHAGSLPDHVDPVVNSSYAQGAATGTLDPAELRWYAQRGSHVAQDRVPTLIIQGTVDNLFTLEEGIANYENLRHRGVPAAMIWFCGGHGVCLTNEGDQSTLPTATLAWLAKYLTHDQHVATGPGFRFVDQHGTLFSAPHYPVTLGTPVTARGSGTLSLSAGGGAGPSHLTGAAAAQNVLAGVAGSITPAPATRAVDVGITGGRHPAELVGPPRLTLTYKGTVPAGTNPTRVFAQLVDDSANLVVGNQITPVPVVLDGRTHTTTVPLEPIAFTLAPHQHLTLQVVATTVAYAVPRLGGTVRFGHITVSLPVATQLTRH